MAEADSSVPKSVSAAVHIVYTERPQQEDLEIYHLRTLSSVLGRSLLFVIITPSDQCRKFVDKWISLRILTKLCASILYKLLIADL